MLGLGQFDEAKECYESLRTLGDNTIADCCLKKVDDIQERDEYCLQHTVTYYGTRRFQVK